MGTGRAGLRGILLIRDATVMSRRGERSQDQRFARQTRVDHAPTTEARCNPRAADQKRADSASRNVKHADMVVQEHFDKGGSGDRRILSRRRQS